MFYILRDGRNFRGERIKPGKPIPEYGLTFDPTSVTCITVSATALNIIKH